MRDVLIVGAGVSGLAAAAELAPSVAVTVVDRLPAVGGTRHYDAPEVRRLERRCRALGVMFELGTTALRWSGGRLLVAAPGRIHWISADRLLYAGGRRPATPAEMGIAGGRLAGILVATVAVHLLEAGVDLGRRPLIVGVSDWAERAATLLRSVQRPVRVLATAGSSPPLYADEAWMGWQPRRTVGTRRVQALIAERDGHERRILCDTLILADAVRPLRNIEGAVSEGENVTFVQSASPCVSATEAEAGARALAAALVAASARSAS